MNKKLVLFTADFPYGTGETFLETEIIFLCKAFEEVVIIPQNTMNHIRIIPSNCKVEQIILDYSFKTRVKSSFNLLNPIVWKELKRIKTVYKKKISSAILKTMLVSFERAKKVEKHIHNRFGKQIDTTLFYSYWCDDAALGITLACYKNKAIKGISRTHGWDTYFDVHHNKYLPFRTFISENLTGLFPISEKGKEVIKSVWKAKTDKVFIVKLGTINSLNPTNEPSGIFKLVSCSSVISVKRVHLIVDALKLIKNRFIEWIHFGDGDLMEDIMKQLPNLPETIIVTLKGRVSNDKIYENYVSSQPHLFINVSSSEGIPVSIMEAMSFGIPVIATSVGGTSEIVSNESGYLLSANPTPEEIAQQIERFMNMDEIEYRRYSANAYKIWNEQYNAEKNYSDFTSFILTLK